MYVVVTSSSIGFAWSFGLCGNVVRCIVDMENTMENGLEEDGENGDWGNSELYSVTVSKFCE